MSFDAFSDDRDHEDSDDRDERGSGSAAPGRFPPYTRFQSGAPRCDLVVGDDRRAVQLWEFGPGHARVAVQGCASVEGSAALRFEYDGRVHLVPCETLPSLPGQLTLVFKTTSMPRVTELVEMMKPAVEILRG